MRVLPALLLTLVLAAGCSTDEPAKESPNVQLWRAGDAVVVLAADVGAGTTVDVGLFGARPGVVASSVKNGTLRLSFSRRAMLVDLAALKLDLARTPGISNVRETFVDPRP